ncbi:hypothetical protein SAY86_019755 [Trapa natans]|uniref:Protein CHAPERONE-LIKE PROTEIN OF POR1, chloroplastic n=1 Tax=Trapa natans TaxID=22666 RepID=A0AAN7M1C1_TRANT|nr:hypothetical protein SAY86_019755 [Trapa natans]
MAAAALSVRPNRLTPGPPLHFPPVRLPGGAPRHALRPYRTEPWRCVQLRVPARAAPPVVRASYRADDSASFEMSVENALKLLGVPETASFDEILSAKNSIVAACKNDQEAIAQVEAAYDMLLMRSLTQRRAGKVVSSNIRYADVKPVGQPQWLQSAVKSSLVSIDTPSTRDLGLQAGVYGSLMVLTYVNGTSTPATPYGGADVPGLILATSFGASLYFMTKRNVKLGKAIIITMGGLVAGAMVGSAVENWLQVDIVPFLGIHSPAALISEFILFSQLFISLYLM